MYEEAKRRNLQLLLAAGVPQERIQGLTCLSVRTIRRIWRAAAKPEPAAPTGHRGVDRSPPPCLPAGGTLALGRIPLFSCSS